MNDKTAIVLQFVLGFDFVSWLISWFSAGHFSHVDAVVPVGHPKYQAGYLIGARSDAIGGKPPGVQVRPPNYERWARRVVFTIPCTADQEAAFWAFIEAQIGKGYDMSAIFAFIVNRDWRNTAKWFCSELQAAALEIAKIIGTIFTGYNKVPPVMLADILSAIAGVTIEDLSTAKRGST
jgi:hypothetical protein